MRRILLLSSLALVLGACVSGSRDRSSDASASGALTIPGSDMNGPLLQALRSRVGAMTISNAGTPCPRITFRGSRSATRQGDPSVYVDGALMADTCILQQIQAADVEYVTIYTGGANIPAGFQHNPFGTIIVQRVRL
jgi:hypothetical protein